MASYRVVRFFQDENLPSKTLKWGLDLEEAKAHCNAPESCSNTCTTPHGIALTKKTGPWFDGFVKEK